MSTATVDSLDTYEMPAEQAEPADDKLAKYREQVKEEQAEKSTRHSMSEAALAKLRAIKEQDHIAAVNGARFKYALQSVIITHENLIKLVDRCYAQGFTDEESGEFQPWGYLNEKGEFVAHGSQVKHLDRRAHKLQWWLNAGFRLGQEIETPGQIMFFSELTAEEIKMSDATFSNTWDTEAAAKIRKSRINRGLIEDVISPGYCKSGKQCIRYGMDEKRHPAFKQGKSGYCSRNCSESHRARAKRSEESISEVQTTAPSVESQI